VKQIIALPSKNNCLCPHFGHCEKFIVFHTEGNEIISETYLDPPPHEPGLLPSWLASKGITHIIAGGMGQRAIMLFRQNNIGVSTGAAEKPAKLLTEDFLNNKLETGNNACDH